MHQRRTLRPSLRRFILPLGVASALAWSFVAITTIMANGCFPLCVIYNDSNPEWYLFMCYLC